MPGEPKGTRALFENNIRPLRAALHSSGLQVPHRRPGAPTLYDRRKTGRTSKDWRRPAKLQGCRPRTICIVRVGRREPDSLMEIAMSTAAARSMHSPASRAQAASAKEVVAQHLKCFREGDLEGILADYAPGAVFFTPDGALRGVDEIRPLFQAMIAEFQEPGTEFNMRRQFVEGDHAYILWTAETADNVYELGTDTFVVRDGKIVAQSFTCKIAPKR